jgi:hypothetical protein
MLEMISSDGGSVICYEAHALQVTIAEETYRDYLHCMNALALVL